MKRIFIVSGSRADYNMNRWVFKSMQNCEMVDVHHIDLRDYSLQPDIALASGQALGLMDRFIKENNPDYILVLGDRWEILQTVIVGTIHQVPIIHLGGGETSIGSYDDDFRDCISRMSKYHFVVTEKCKKNLNKIGIYDNIYVVGSPRMDYLYHIRINKDIIKDIGLDPKKDIGLVVYHPETKSKDMNEKTDMFFDALSNFDMQYIIINPNNDTGSDYIKKKIKSFRNKGVKKYDSVCLEDWVSLLDGVDVMIGNSSAGIMETPTFKLPFVNVGDRQKGRERSGNVIDADYENMETCLELSLMDDYKAGLFFDPFGDGVVSDRIVRILEEMI